VIPAYNLVLHLARQSSNPDPFYNRISQYLLQPITSSPQHGIGLALTVLSTMFNIIPADDETRYHVFNDILKLVRQSGTFDSIKPHLKNLESWFADWESEDDEQRKLYLSIAEVAAETGEQDTSYDYLIKALRTIPADQSSSDEARQLSLRALKDALQSPSHFDFQDLTSLDAIQALRQSEPVYLELLELFTSDQLEDYNDFKDEHDGWVEEQSLDSAALNRKMRLLTLASLAASTGQTRSLPYANIAKALQVPEEDVEMWVIDVIRAGLVEGKLSQLNKTFLIHRSTYRVFGDSQWREVDARLALWKTSLQGVLKIIRQEKESYAVQQETDRREVGSKVNGFGQGGDRRDRGPRDRQQQQHQQQQQQQRPPPAEAADS
jgi:translation initiation factor 3 subunit M